MSEEARIIIPLDADVTDLLKNLALAGKEASKAENKIDSLIAKLKELSGISDSKITVTVDVDESALDGVESTVKGLDGLSPTVTIDADYSDLLKADSLVSGIDGLSAEIDINADTTDAKTEIASLDTSTSIDVTVTADTAAAEADISGLDNDAPNVDVTVTADIAAAESDIKGLDSSAPKVDIQVTADTSDLDGIKQELQTLKKIAVIDLVLDTTGAALAAASFVRRFPIIGTLNDTAAAVRKVEAQTNQSFSGLDKIINNVFTDGLADSRDQIAQVSIGILRAGGSFETLEADARSAFNAAAASGEDVNEVLKVQERLVAAGLADSYTEAADIIATGFQSGANRSGDLLDTLFEYSTVFSAMGIDAGTALNLINQGLDAGTFNSDKLGDSFKELGIRITEAVGSGEGATFDALDKLDLFDEAAALEAGEITGTQFADAAIIAAREKGSDFDLIEIFGTPLEDFGVKLFGDLDFGSGDATLIQPGLAQDAADTLTDTLGKSVEELAKTVETRLADSFKLAGMPLSEILDGIKEKVQELSDLLKSGEGLPEALEIALEAPGLAEEIRRFEASLGNFLIDLMLALAGVQSSLGIGDKGENLRARASEAAATQFAYDIKVANPDEISDVINRAVDRGVDLTTVSDQLNTAAVELISQGDLDRAQELVRQINQIPNAVQKFQADGFETVDLEFAVDPNATAEQIAAARDAAILLYEQQTGTNLRYSIGEVTLTPKVDTVATQAAIDETIVLIDNGMSNLQKTATIFTNPIQGILDAFNSPGGQNLTQNAGAIAAGNGAYGSVGDYLDAAKGTEAYVVPYMDMSKAAEETTAAIGEVSVVVRDAEGNVVAASDAMVTGLDNTTTAATETAVQLDTVTVATDTLQTQGGEKIMAFATLAQNAGQIASSSWQNFAATLANVQSMIPAGGVPAGDGTLQGAMDWLTATVGSMEGKATGGTVYANTPYMVGEEGAEMFVPNTDGSIVDANNTALIMDALQLMATMSPSNISNISNTNYNMGGIKQTINTQSNAQSVSASAALARGIRSIR